MATSHKVVAVIAGAACGMAGWWLGAASNSGTTAVPVAVDDVKSRLASIDASLVEIENRLERARQSAPDGADRTPVRQAEPGADPGLAGVLASLAELKTVVEKLRVDVAQSNDLIRAGLPQVAKNPGAVEAALAVEKSEPGANRRRHFCWTQAQVYLTYGLPDVTGNSGGNPFWGYLLDDENGLFFIFSSGVVDMVTRDAPVAGLLYRKKEKDGP